MWPCRDKNNPQLSDRLQILDQIRFLLLAQGCLKVIVVVIDYVGERHKSSIVVKAALVDFLRIPKSSQFCCHVSVIRSALGLEIVDPDLLSFVQVPARFRK